MTGVGPSSVTSSQPTGSNSRGQTNRTMVRFGSTNGSGNTTGGASRHTTGNRAVTHASNVTSQRRDVTSSAQTTTHATTQAVRVINKVQPPASSTPVISPASMTQQPSRSLVRPVDAVQRQQPLSPNSNNLSNIPNNTNNTNSVVTHNTNSSTPHGQPSNQVQSRRGLVDTSSVGTSISASSGGETAKITNPAILDSASVVPTTMTTQFSTEANAQAYYEESYDEEQGGEMYEENLQDQPQQETIETEATSGRIPDKLDWVQFRTRPLAPLIQDQLDSSRFLATTILWILAAFYLWASIQIDNWFPATLCCIYYIMLSFVFVFYNLDTIGEVLSWFCIRDISGFDQRVEWANVFRMTSSYYMWAIIWFSNVFLLSVYNSFVVMWAAVLHFQGEPQATKSILTLVRGMTDEGQALFWLTASFSIINTFAMVRHLGSLLQCMNMLKYAEEVPHDSMQSQQPLMSSSSYATHLNSAYGHNHRSSGRIIAHKAIIVFRDFEAIEDDSGSHYDQGLVSQDQQQIV